MGSTWTGRKPCLAQAGGVKGPAHLAVVDDRDHPVAGDGPGQVGFRVLIQGAGSTQVCKTVGETGFAR